MSRNRLLDVGSVLLGAIFTILAFPPFGLEGMVFLAPVPWLIVARRTCLRTSFVLGTLGSFCVLLAGLWWMTVVSFPGLLVTSLILSVYGGLLFAVTGWILRHAGLPTCFVAPFVWIALDYLRSFFLTGFAWLYLGHALADWLPLIQVCDLTGAYGVTFVVVFVGSAGLDVIQARRRILVGGVALGLVVAVFSYGFYRLEEAEFVSGPRVAIIQANIRQALKVSGTGPEEIQGRHVLLTREALEQAPDLVIWPETMFPGFFGNTPVQTRELLDLVREAKTSFLVGSNSVDLEIPGPEFRTYNSAYLIAPDGMIRGRYDKMHLVPFGEYVPLRNIAPRLEEIVLQTAGFVPGIRPGEEPVLFDLGDIRFAVPICFEVVPPWIGRRFVGQGAQFLINLTNEGWFSGSSEFEQLEQIAVFRAVENRVPLVRAGNTGISSIIDANGRIKPGDRIRKGDRMKDVDGILVRAIPLDHRQSLYTRVGDVFAIGCVLALLVLGIHAWGNRKRVI